MTSRPVRVPSTGSDSQPATHRANPRPDDMTRRKRPDGRRTERTGVRNPYSQLLAIKGTRGFVSAGFVGRLPMSMMGLGTVLLVQSSTGSYGVAGAVAACLAIASSAAAPLVGRWIDRLGQARVLLPSLAVHTVGLLTLLAAAHWRTPRWSLFAASRVSN